MSALTPPPWLGDTDAMLWKLFTCLGILTALTGTLWTARRRGIHMSMEAVYAGLTGCVAGAYAWPLAMGDPQGGASILGALLGGFLCGAGTLHLMKCPVFTAMDIAAPWMLLGEAVARMGCLTHGCCFGAPFSLPWAITWSSGAPCHALQKAYGLLPQGASYSLPVHPTQLYYIFALVIISLFLMWFSRRMPAGALTAFWAIMYGMSRLCIDVFRGDMAPAALGLTLSQWAGLGLSVLGAGLAIRTFKASV